MPIAVVFYDKRLDVWAPGAHTATFRGNQLAFAAGVAAARIMQRDGVLDNVRGQGAYALERLQELERAQRMRRRGSWRGSHARCRDHRPGDRFGRLRAGARDPASRLEQRLILELGGRETASCRLLPPLNITRETLDQALEILTRRSPRRSGAISRSPDVRRRPTARSVRRPEAPHRRLGIQPLDAVDCVSVAASRYGDQADRSKALRTRSVALLAATSPTFRSGSSSASPCTRSVQRHTPRRAPATRVMTSKSMTVVGDEAVGFAGNEDDGAVSVE